MSSKNYRYYLLPILWLTAFNPAFSQKAQGYVFYDENRNGIMDTGEKGIQGVPVSNTEEVILTDQDGFFSLEMNGNDFIVVSKLNRFEFPVDQYNLPRNHYHHKPDGSPDYLEYKGKKPTGPLPEMLYFPAFPSDTEAPKKALVIGDPQMADLKRLNYLRDGQLPMMMDKNADFFMVLGDIADNYLDILPHERELMKLLGITGYRVIGNHDLDMSARDNFDAAEPFKAVYGPVDYSFEYNSHHFIVLNNIQYQGYNQTSRKKGNYTGGLSRQQIQWITNDLRFTSPEKTIVVLSHIPFLEAYSRKGSIDSLMQTLNTREKVLFLSGHLHTVQSYDIKTKQGIFEGLVVGAVCGSWWTGPLNEHGLPYATCMDGSPQGFFEFDFSTKAYSRKFVPAHYPESYQMHIEIGKEKDKNDFQLIVNWFTGKPCEKVFARINDHKPVELQNFTGKSDFVVRTLHSRVNPDQWTPRPVETDHLWKTTLLPRHFIQGINKIEVIAKRNNGDTQVRHFFIDPRH